MNLGISELFQDFIHDSIIHFDYEKTKQVNGICWNPTRKMFLKSSVPIRRSGKLPFRFRKDNLMNREISFRNLSRSLIVTLVDSCWRVIIVLLTVSCGCSNSSRCTKSLESKNSKRRSLLDRVESSLGRLVLSSNSKRNEIA